MAHEEEEKPSLLTRMFNNRLQKTGTNALMKIPGIKQIAKHFAPKVKESLIKYLQGFNEETNTHTEERIIMMRLTKDKNNARVYIMRSGSVTITPGENCMEDIFDVEEYMTKFLTGQFDKDLNNLQEENQ